MKHLLTIIFIAAGLSYFGARLGINLAESWGLVASARATAFDVLADVGLSINF